MKEVMLFLLIFICGISFSMGAPVVYQPPSYVRDKSLVIARDSYEDIRVDSNKDGLVDYWYLKSGTIVVEYVFWNPKSSAVRMTSFGGNTVRVIEYQKKHNRWYLSQLENRKIRVFNGFHKSDPGQCLPKEKIEAELAKLTESTTDEILSQNVSQIVDSSCESLFEGRNKRTFLNGIQGSLSIGKSALLKCFEDPEKKRKLLNNFSDEKSKIETQLEAVKAKYQSLCLGVYNSPQTYAKKITCKAIEGSVSRAQVSEGGEIVFFKAKDGTESVKEIEKLFTHEFLHPMGVAGEDSMAAILNPCFENEAALAELKVKPSSISRMAPEPIKNIEQRAAEIAKTQTVAIPKELAETALPVPTQQELSRAFTEQQTAAVQFNQNPEGASEKAYQESYRETAPIRSRATQLLAAFGGVQPANAATLAGGGGSSGEVGSGSGGSYSSRSPASTVLKSASKKAGSVSDEYKVVEEYTTDPDPVRVGAKPSVSRNSDSSSSARVNLKTSGAEALADASAAGAVAAAANLPSGGELGNVPAAGGGGGGGFSPPASGGGRGIASTGGGGSSGGGRSPASTRGSSANFNNLSKNEVLSILVNDDYEVAKSRLSNRAFTDSLKKNSITILDRTGQPVVDKNGKPVSAERGNTVLLDRGDRFVRQK